jgi:hypothetical protein
MVPLSLSLPVISRQTDLPHSAYDWLNQLQDSCWIYVPGWNPKRRRVIVTLLHGNEPSGTEALLAWLKEDVTPACDLYCLLASVATALTPPEFSHRMLPGSRDLNRCFAPPYDDDCGRLARQITDDIAYLEPEALIDIHNTSGSGPSFAVAMDYSPRHLALISWFCNRVIVPDVRLGSLMEVDAGCPTITIECGGARDEESLQVAYQGIHQVAVHEDIFKSPPHEPEVLLHPQRVELKPGVSVRYHEAPCEDADITLWPSIEHCNFGTTGIDTSLGWVGNDGIGLIQALDRDGEDHASRLFRIDRGWLHPAMPLKIFMATSNPEIATSDCLFYAVPAD